MPGRAGADVKSGLDAISGPFGGGWTSVQTVPELIARVVSMLLFITGGIAVLFLIIGGYWYITSGGNEEQAEKGKKTLVNAIIGVVIVVMSYVIVNVVVDLVMRTTY